MYSNVHSPVVCESYAFASYTWFWSILYSLTWCWFYYLLVKIGIWTMIWSIFSSLSDISVSVLHFWYKNGAGIGTAIFTTTSPVSSKPGQWWQSFTAVSSLTTVLQMSQNASNLLLHELLTLNYSLNWELAYSLLNKCVHSHFASLFIHWSDWQLTLHRFLWAQVILLSIKLSFNCLAVFLWPHKKYYHSIIDSFISCCMMFWSFIFFPNKTYNPFRPCLVSLIKV